MKAILRLALAILSFFAVVSCEKDVELVNPAYRNISISSGCEFEIPVLTSDWNIESVRDLSSNMLICDKESNPIALDGEGEIEAANGWLTLVYKKDNILSVRLKENFDDQERGFVICIDAGGDKDYVTFQQHRGKGYKLIKKEFQEIEELREVYMSDKECRTLMLTNLSSKPVWEPTDAVFSGVIYKSIFESDDYGAFDWCADEDIKIELPPLIVDNMQRGNESCLYRKGTSTLPYNKSFQDKILMQPSTTIYFKGNVKYCKRVFNYTFTIANEVTRSQFDIKGTCTQISPISSSLIISDKQD